MVGKPNIPMKFENEPFIVGASITTPGLDALDQEREASMADEGGCAGAIMESQEILILVPSDNARRKIPIWLKGLAFGLAVIGVVVFARKLRPSLPDTSY